MAALRLLWFGTFRFGERLIWRNGVLMVRVTVSGCFETPWWRSRYCMSPEESLSIRRLVTSAKSPGAHCYHMCYHCYHIGYSEIYQRKYRPLPSATCLVVPLCGQFLTLPYSNSNNLSISYGSTIHLKVALKAKLTFPEEKNIVKGL